MLVYLKIRNKTQSQIFKVNLMSNTEHKILKVYCCDSSKCAHGALSPTHRYPIVIIDYCDVTYMSEL